MKNKSMLWSLLALNAVTLPLMGATPKYEGVYNKIAKNLETGKSNDESYKLLNQILSKRNKELKDLYSQSDYIVKPEYLEWQIFYNGFYNYINRGGSKKSITSTNFGPTEKTINLGIVIPIKGRDVAEVNYNVLPPNDYDFNLHIGEVNRNVAGVDDYDFPIGEFPIAPTFSLGIPTRFAYTYTDDVGIVTQDIKFNSSGSAVFENLNLTSSGKTKYTLDTTISPNSLSVDGTVQYQNGAVTGNTPTAYTHGSIAPNFSIINIGIDGDFNINGNWEFYTNHLKANSMITGFLSYRPMYVTTDSKVVFDGTLELTGTGNNSKAKIGLSLDLRNTTAPSNTKVTLENKGTIKISDQFGIGMQVLPYSDTGTIEGELINSGVIELTGTNGNYTEHATGVAIAHENLNDRIGKVNVVPGIINVKGNYNTGLSINSIKTSMYEQSRYSNVTVDGTDGLITVAGNYSTGVIVAKGMSSPNIASPTFFDNIKNLNILVTGYYGTGLRIEPFLREQRTMTISDSVIESLKFSDSAFQSTLIYLQGTNGYPLVLDESLKNSLGVINNGYRDIVVAVGSGSYLINEMPIEIGNGTRSMYALVSNWTTPWGDYNMGKIDNYGDVINNSREYQGYGGIALGAFSYGVTFTNEGNIDMSGGRSVGIYNKGTFTSTNDHISISDDRGVAVFGDFSHIGSLSEYLVSEAIVKSNRIDINGEKGVAVYSNGGNIELAPNTKDSLEITVNGKDSYAFFYNAPIKTSIPTKGKIKITDKVNANLQNGAIGFYYDGAGGTADISAYLNDIIDSSNGILNIQADENSYNIFVENSILNLSDIIDLDTGNIRFFGDGKSKVYNSSLVIDKDSNLDQNNTIGDKTYSRMELGLTDITIDNNITISGSETGQTGVVLNNKYNETLNTAINNGVIDLSGFDGKGMYSKRGNLINNGVINLQGEKSIGLYSKGSKIENTGDIYIANNGIGMYSTTYIDASDNPTGLVNSDIINTGKIEALTSMDAIGIFGNNDTAGGTTNVTLSENSNIDMSKSNGGIGIYVNNANLNNNSYSSAGKITVGENGLGLYSKDSIVNIDNLELNLVGDNSIGIFADGNTIFNGNGNINIDGNGIIVFNIRGNGSFNQNFNISATSGSNYIFQNISDTKLFYDATASLATGGLFLAGTNSAVLLGENSNLISTGTNVVGLGLSGKYPLPDYINGVYIENEATNLGKISLGDDSIGIYTTDGANSLNDGEITVGSVSVALYGKGADTNIKNNGDIKVGLGSVGMYLKDGENIVNSGSIFGVENKTVGIFLNGDSKIVENTGNIDLSGKNSIGIYTQGDNIQNIYNTGTIKIGDSDSLSEPNVGIYNNNSNGIVNNNGDIIAGSDTIGIYNAGGEVKQNSGKIEIGKNGLGIYSDSGMLNLNGGNIQFNDMNSIGIYGKNNAQIDNNMILDVEDENYGIILNSGANLINRNISTLGENSILVYSNGKGTILNEIGADITMTKSNSIGFYLENEEILTNKASITGNTGVANIGIYSKNGSIYNSGDIKIGDSLIIDPKNSYMNFYSVGIYGEQSENIVNSGNIEIGENAIGIYGNENKNGLNTGNIDSVEKGAIGIFLVRGTMENHGDITLSGDSSIGIAGTYNSTVKNNGTITMNGNDSIGIFGQINSKIINEKIGKIYINGNDSIGVQLSENAVLENYGEIKIADGVINSKDIVDNTSKKDLPSIINAGIIKVDEKFEINGFNLIIKGDPDSFRVPTIEEITQGDYDLKDIDAGFLLTNSVTIKAPSFDFGDNTVGIDPLFTQGTNARVYKFENVFDPSTPEGGVNEGELNLKSTSLTFDAIPVFNSQDKVDIWMEKIDYDKFTEGAWYDEFAKNIEGKYLNATGDALKMYDKLDLITEVEDLRDALESLSGSFYANRNQREFDIMNNYKNNLNILQNSKNKTKENVKLSIIAGGGKTKESTSGVDNYDYKTYGVSALREVERTYKHTYSYSGGYTRTSFDVGENNSTDSTDTFYLGIHNKYKTNDWVFKSDLIGNLSLHDTERKVSFLDNKKLNANYNAYGVNLSNKVEKELEVAKGVKIVPGVGLDLGYVSHDNFKEKGDFGNLELKRNEAYSINPKIGVRVEGEKELGNNKDTFLKGNLGINYGYELGDVNKEERATLDTIETGYHKLAKVEDEKGKASVNAEISLEKGNYGLYVTGEYSFGSNKKEESKVGLGVKVSF